MPKQVSRLWVKYLIKRLEESETFYLSEVAFLKSISKAKSFEINCLNEKVKKFISKENENRDFSYLDRIMNRVEVKEGTNCLLYKNRKDPYGYGRILFRGKDCKVFKLIYHHFKGPLKGEETCIRHLCNEKLCCNIDHLEAGTNYDNVKDKMKSSNFYNTKKLLVTYIDGTQKEFPSLISLSKEIGISVGSIVIRFKVKNTCWKKFGIKEVKKI